MWAITKLLWSKVCIPYAKGFQRRIQYSSEFFNTWQTVAQFWLSTRKQVRSIVGKISADTSIHASCIMHDACLALSLVVFPTEMFELDAVCRIHFIGSLSQARFRILIVVHFWWVVASVEVVLTENRSYNLSSFEVSSCQKECIYPSNTLTKRCHTLSFASEVLHFFTKSLLLLYCLALHFLALLRLVLHFSALRFLAFACLSFCVPQLLYSSESLRCACQVCVFDFAQCTFWL